jgi:NAD(P) transhydrogenase subunit beta
MNITIQLLYLFSSVLFIIGIKMMNKTKDARAGNLLSSVGMLIAIIATLMQI